MPYGSHTEGNTVGLATLLRICCMMSCPCHDVRSASSLSYRKMTPVILALHFQVRCVSLGTSIWLWHSLPADFGYETSPAAGLASLLRHSNCCHESHCDNGHPTTANVTYRRDAIASNYHHRNSLQSHRTAINCFKLSAAPGLHNSAKLCSAANL